MLRFRVDSMGASDWVGNFCNNNNNYSPSRASGNTSDPKPISKAVLTCRILGG